MLMRELSGPHDNCDQCCEHQKVPAFLTRREGSEWYYHWALALHTGMRSGELYAVKWQDVDLNSLRVNVRESWNSKIGFKSTKSGDQRIVPINSELALILKELRLSGLGGEFVLPRIAKWSKGEQARELRGFLISTACRRFRSTIFGRPGRRFC